VLVAQAVPGAGPAPVWSGGGASHLGAPSRDGRFLSGIEPGTGALLLRDLLAGTERRLTPPGKKGEFAYFSVLSRDGKQAAYAWFNEERFYELRLVPTGGGPPRTLLRNEETGFVQPCAFSADAKHVLTLLFRKDNVSQIALVSAEDGSVRVLKSLNWVYPKRMDLSPDGQTIVYDNFAADGVSQRDVFLLDVAGRKERRLVESPADDQFPVFSADGRSVYFSSDRPWGKESAAPRLWSVRVEDGALEMLRDGLGRFLVLGLSGGQLLYATRAGGMNVYHAGIDLKSGKLTSAPERIGEGWAVAWSPDGRKMAWLGRRASENFGTEARYVAVFDAAAGRVRTLEARLAHIERLAWTDDAEGILASGSDGKGRGGVFRLDLSDGAASAVVRDTEAPYTGYPASGAFVGKGREIRRGSEVVAHAEGDVTVLAAAPGGKLAAWFDGKGIGVTGGARLVAGREVRAMVFTPAGDGLMVVEEDELWLQRMDGSRTRVARAAAPIDSVSLSPDGGTILFAAGRPATAVHAVDLPK
jgi:Tol biopolymer transport system component